MTAANNEQTLAAGLAWLYDTEQPDDALVSHHGEMLPGVGNRLFGFIPQGWDGHAIVTVEVQSVEYKVEQGYDVPANPLEAGELEDLTSQLAALGATVISTWNGHPATTGSLALQRSAHPSLLAAVSRCSVGCLEHPRESVFCKCGWWQQGYGQAVRPTPSLAVAEERT
ncbi:hypothetical protein AB0J43_05480 [Nonomuraea fuscirosea]